MEVGIHQIRKLAASHSVQAGHNELTIKEKMGFSEVRILRKITLLRFRILKLHVFSLGESLFRTERTTCRNQIRINIGWL